MSCKRSKYGRREEISDGSNLLIRQQVVSVKIPGGGGLLGVDVRDFVEVE